MSWVPLVLALAALQASEDQPVRPHHDEGAGNEHVSGRTKAPAVDLEAVEVIGRRAAALLPPEAELDAAAIDALAAADVGDLILRTMDAFGLDGEPIVLVNGRRVPSSGLYSGFPPDAVMRLEVLPNDAGGLYAGDPGRRVLNLVLESRFKSRDGLVEAMRPTAGGASTIAGDLRRSSIDGERSVQLGARLSRESSLRAGEYNLFDRPGGEAVTLRPATDAIVGNWLATRMLGDWSATFGLNGAAQRSDMVSLFAGEPVSTLRRSGSLALTAGLSGELRGWSLQLGFSSRLSTINQTGLADVSSSNGALSTRIDTNRTLFDLPNGPVTVNLSGEVARYRSASGNDAPARWFKAGDLAGAVSIPLSGSKQGEEGPMVALGDVSLTLGVNRRDGDSGGGSGLNSTLTWAPVRSFRVSGSWARATESLSSEQRYAPAFYGTPITVYDFEWGRAAEVALIRGGNPDLQAPRAEQILVTFSAGPFSSWRITGITTFSRQDTSNAIAALPSLTPEMERAFPERFRRDPMGRLVSIDQRSINFRSVVSEKLSNNISMTLPLGDDGDRRSSLRATLNHAWRIRETSMLSEHLPAMDRLAGDGGGLPSQELNLTLEGAGHAWNLTAIARWRDSYRVRRNIGENGADDLHVDALGTIDLKLGYRWERMLASAAGGAPSRRAPGLQVEFGIDNVFDSRPSATLGDGRPAPGYEAKLQDPIGRTVRIALRRRF